MKKKKRAKRYDSLVKTDLSFDELLKLAAHTPLEKQKPKQKKKKR